VIVVVVAQYGASERGGGFVHMSMWMLERYECPVSSSLCSSEESVDYFGCEESFWYVIFFLLLQQKRLLSMRGFIPTHSSLCLLPMTDTLQAPAPISRILHFIQGHGDI
jgi:hypothetical protein